ncbi:MAG: hypothetical protein M3076_03355 [Actinomycetota bacterium]|nr:hypothetical protein [Actinomycetota bacterium]
MLIPSALLEDIRSGAITSIYRRWSRPHARPGATHKIPGGLIAIDAVRTVEVGELTDADARPAGFATAEALTTELFRWPGERIYRIDFHYDGPDPLIALREVANLDEATIAETVARLDRMDGRSSRGAWTRPVLLAIREHPAIRAAELASRFGQEVAEFKRDVRKLKALGLTISLERGYELSPRGLAIVEALAPPRSRSGVSARAGTKR